MKAPMLLLAGLVSLTGCYGDSSDVSRSGEVENRPPLGQQQPAARLVPADQQMASGRYRTEIQVANGAQPVSSSSENFTTTAEVSVIR
ncbi:hypothetical protein ACMG4M_10940 [Alcanivorax sp. IL3]|uniref:hypothetical protein n=1 Tax=unclassified Alcanivorax TaxID=2638842 RepID=UPI0039C2E5B7